jgi:hypothetical protein
MHTMSRPICLLHTSEGFVVKCYRGWVNPPYRYTFETYDEAIAFAHKKFATKYYSKACIIDEIER